MSDRVLLGFAPPAPVPARHDDGRTQATVRRSRRGWFGGRGPGGPGGLAPVDTWPAALLAALHAAWRRHRSRGSLLELSAHLRKDIGISYADAEAEGNKPFWMP